MAGLLHLDIDDEQVFQREFNPFDAAWRQLGGSQGLAQRLNSLFGLAPHQDVQLVAVGGRTLHLRQVGHHACSSQGVGHLKLQHLASLHIGLHGRRAVQGDDLAVVEQSQRVAVLGLVHVVGGDENRHPLRR